MIVRLTAMVLAVFFLGGSVQTSAQPNSFNKSYELKIVASSYVKSFSSEKSLGENEFTYSPETILLNFKTTFVLRAIQSPVLIASFIHKPSQAFILFRVLRN